jgi:hypothetical protein
MGQPRFVAGDFSTDFIAEEWDGRSKQDLAWSSTETSNVDEQRHQPSSLLSDEQVVAIVGSLLMQEHLEKQGQRLTVTDEAMESGSRWRDASRREILRR